MCNLKWDSITEAGGKEFGSFNLPNDLLAKRHMRAAGSRAEEDVHTAHSLERRQVHFIHNAGTHLAYSGYAPSEWASQFQSYLANTQTL